MGISLWRLIAAVAGIGILAAVAYTTIAAQNGEGAFLVAAIAAGVASASIITGMTWASGRRFLAAGFCICIVSGELWSVLQSGHRLVAISEAQQAPLRAAAEEGAKAERRVEAAKAAVEALPTTSPRLSRAQADKAKADAAVVEKSAEKACREHCRLMLGKAVDDAVAEVAAARAALTASGETARAELANARAALASLKAPASPTPLADRIGVAGWTLDLLGAALGSIAANGLGACLLAFAGHWRRHEAQQPEPAPAQPVQEVAGVHAALAPVVEEMPAVVEQKPREKRAKAKPAKPRRPTRPRRALGSSPLGRPIKPLTIH